MILIVGTGKIAEEYIKCLIKLNKTIEIVGNTKKKTDLISKKYNIKCFNGGIENFKFIKKYENIIIATPVLLLFEHLKICINKCKGLFNILVEKPGCLYSYQLKHIIEIKKNINIYIAYNRRFYSSTLKGKEIIDKDPIKHLSFKLNAYKLKEKGKIFSQECMNSYFTAMTTHLVDMAFFFTNIPKKINTNISGYGNLLFHKKGCFFKGDGITLNNIPFNYIGDWSQDGFWNIELFLNSGKKLYYQPLEQLKIINKDSSEQIIDKKQIDIDFKPGFYKQVKSFISNKKNLLDIKTHYNNLLIYYKMVNYNSEYNVLLIGCGNIGFRHLQAFINMNLAINITIVEINENSIKRINKYIKNIDHVKVQIYKNIENIKNIYFDICTVATCSKERLKLINMLINNNNIKYISNIVLEKITFQNIKQFKEYEILIKKYKNCKTYISTHWLQIYDNKYLIKFKNPQIEIKGGKWNLLCNGIHFIIFVLHFYNTLTLKIDNNYEIIDSKRNSYKELFGKLYNDNIKMSSQNNDEYKTIIIQEGKHKLVIIENKIINFSYYYNDILNDEFTKPFLHTSTYFETEYRNLLLCKNNNLCNYQTGFQAHKILFDSIRSIFKNELIPIT